MRYELDRLLDDFAKLRRLDALSSDGEGCYRLEVDDQFEVRLFQRGGHVFLEGSLGELPAGGGGDQDQLARLLRLYLGRLKERHEVLTLSPEADILILYRRLRAADLTLGVLERAIASLVGQLKHWRRWLETESRTSGPASPEMRLFIP